MANAATMSSLYVAVLVCFQPAFVGAAGKSKLKCADDKEGMCSTNYMTGFCSVDLLTSTFDCDKDNYCAKQPSLLVKRTTGCIDKQDTGEGHKCCCNTVDMCTFALLEHHGNKSLIQQCYNMYKMGSSDKIVPAQNYSDQYCVSILTAQKRYPKKKTGEYYSSQSAMHYFYDVDLAKEGQSDRERLFKPFKQMQCSNMIYKPVGKGADTFYQGCERIEYKIYNKKYSGTFCCCYGKAECNKGVTLSSVEITGYKAKATGGTAEVASLLGFYSLLFVTLLPLINQILPPTDML